MSRDLQNAQEPVSTNLSVAESPECGIWLEGKEFFGNNIVSPDGDVADRLACLKLCQEVPGCNAVTLNEQDVDPLCYLKRIDDTLEPVDFESNLHGASVRLCPEQQSTESFDSSIVETEAQIGVPLCNSAFVSRSDMLYTQCSASAWHPSGRLLLRYTINYVWIDAEAQCL